jgi:hypothetical protein
MSGSPIEINKAQIYAMNVPEISKDIWKPLLKKAWDNCDIMFFNGGINEFNIN